MSPVKTPSQITDTISRAPKRVKTTFVWLDALPLDVCTRIVSFLPHRPIIFRDSNQPPYPISLAAVSPFQKRAVAACHSHTIAVPYAYNHVSYVIQSWMDTIDDIYEVRLPLNVSDDDTERKLLSLPTIKKAVIPTYAYLYDALQKGRSLRSLQLVVFTLGPGDTQLPQTDISKLLTECPIEDLSLACEGCQLYPMLPCWAVRMLESIQQENNKLRSLHLNCDSIHVEPLSRVPFIFPNLEEFRLEQYFNEDPDENIRHGYPPEEVDLQEQLLEYLRNLKSVEMINCGTVETFIPFGKSLTVLGSLLRAPRNDVMRLSACPNLRSLEIVLEQGAEASLPWNLCNLRELSLTWKPKRQQDYLDEDFDATDYDDGPRYLHEQYYKPDQEILSTLIQRNKGISKLHLKKVVITSSTIESLLSTLGNELRSLHIPIFHQDESPASRFSRLAWVMMRYNTRVSHLEVCSTCDGILQKPDLPQHVDCDPNVCQFCELHRLFYDVIQTLKLRLLNFSDCGLMCLYGQLRYRRLGAF